MPDLFSFELDEMPTGDMENSVLARQAGTEAFRFLVLLRTPLALRLAWDVWEDGLRPRPLPK